MFEAGDGVAVGAAHGDEDERLEAQPDGEWVELGTVAADDPRLLEGAEPAVAGRHRQPTRAAFWGVSMLFVLTPGADWAYAITSGLRHRSVVPAVGGLLSGHLIATVVVAAGVAALLAGSPAVLAVLTVAGAGYLVWLGLGMLRRPASVQANPEEAAGSAWRQAVKGFGISGLNPKVFLLFLALLPQFVVATASWSAAAQIMVLGLVHVLNCAVVYLGVGVGARTVLRARPSAARWISRISGAAMIIIGAVLIGEQILAQTGPTH